MPDNDSAPVVDAPAIPAKDVAAAHAAADAADAAVDADAAADSSIAPRPRPGFRSKPAFGATEKAGLFAGVMRAAVGCAGLFAALLYLTIQNVTPILAGVSILMMVTGCTSSFRAVREMPALKRVPFILMGACGLVTAVSIVLTMTMGAGSLGPLADLKHMPKHSDGGAPTVSFQPTP